MSIEVKISNRLISYKFAMKFLEKRVLQAKKGDKKDLIWILEHPLTYTSGVRGLESEVIDKKIKIIKTNRGGKITLHNPGQKIVYFVLDLNKKKKDIRKLINLIEECIIKFLKLNGINGSTDKKNIGIWVRNKKIAAIGVKVSKWIAYHGCSINVKNDLKKYSKIIPCGLSNKMVTSVFKEKNKILINSNIILAKIFKEKFNNF
jgi:lipoyl(octanoyl) transferase